MPAERVTAVLAANPGFELLEYHHNEGGAEACVTRNPIVGWKVIDDGAYVEPLCVEMPMTSEAVVKYPDGRVNLPACQTWDNEALWLAAAETRGRQKQKQKLA